VAHERAGQDRKRGAHERRRHEKHQRREAEAQGDTGAEGKVPRRRGCDIRPVREGQHEWGGQAEYADRDLEPPVQGGGSRVPVGPRPEQPRAQAEAAHVGRDDSRD
jgi:hypothetical protein